MYLLQQISTNVTLIVVIQMQIVWTARDHFLVLASLAIQEMDLTAQVVKVPCKKGDHLILENFYTYSILENF